MPQPTTLAQQIEFFFAPPVPLQDGSPKSTLHLNRREVQDCYLGDVIEECQVASDRRNRHRLFATVMVMVAGVDLLAKFYAGSDRPGGVGDRIMDFAERFMFTGEARARRCAEVLYYGCRNAVMHSFTLHNSRYTLRLTQDLPSGAIWKTTEPDGSVGYMASVSGLYSVYVVAIARYRAALESEAELQARFSAMFPMYGSIGFFSVSAEPLNPTASPGKSG